MSAIVNKAFASTVLSLLVLWSGSPSAIASYIYTQGAADGMAGRDWYSSPNYYWVDTSSGTVQASHDGDNRWSYRGVIIFNINSLDGVTLEPATGMLNFYSFGFSGVALQYYGATGAEVTTAYAQAGGTTIATLPAGEGWLAYDVTSQLQSGIDANADYIGFIFNATVNFGSGSIASSEDTLSRGAFLQVIPEPGILPTMIALIAVGAVALYRRKRK